MAATVKPIEAKTVHRIQSGQVIVDLCSVVKELVENSLDADATSIDVRFKNNGLDEIEVQDNGNGIAAADYDSVGLKHRTSKLSTFSDLSTLSTFGFRGEALSSLCALSNFHITTAQAHEAPKGHRLDFHASGELKATTIVACQKGTTATVTDLFDSLPVRKKELAKNLKREYSKVVGLLQAYACISTNVKFTVKNAVPKGRSTLVFATNLNATTRDNLANVYGAKTLTALIPLDLDFDIQPSASLAQDPKSLNIGIQGHVSKPVFGEGRQTPDRQMFFVNGRPCGLPQIAKAFNEVYKAFNVSQSPFIFANLLLDTSAYDVNVSPDKRSILLHNASQLIDELKTVLNDMFERHEQTVPHSQLKVTGVPPSRQINTANLRSSNSSPLVGAVYDSHRRSPAPSAPEGQKAITVSPDSNQHTLVGGSENATRTFSTEQIVPGSTNTADYRQQLELDPREIVNFISDANETTEIDTKTAASKLEQEQNFLVENGLQSESDDDSSSLPTQDTQPTTRSVEMPSESNQDEMTRPEPPILTVSQQARNSSPGLVQNVFDRVRPRRFEPQIATITIGDRTVTRMLGSQGRVDDGVDHQRSAELQSGPTNASRRLSGFKAVQLNERFRTPRKPRRLSSEHGEFVRIGEDNEASDDDIEDADERGAEEHVPNMAFQGSSAPRHVSDANFRPSNRCVTPKKSKFEHEDTDSVGIASSVRSSEADSDSDYVDENKKKSQEDGRVQELIRRAEESAAQQSARSEKRLNQALKGGWHRESTVHIEVELEVSDHDFQAHSTMLRRTANRIQNYRKKTLPHGDRGSEEQLLTLTVSKSDFSNMQIVGQFNLGFIIAVRTARSTDSEFEDESGAHDELFIIDQHASDEKYNFERLQADTTVGNQRLVRPIRLDLTAVEEEVLVENVHALEKNGFIVEIDDTGDYPIGRTCELISLPLSKEVVFGTKDLDELLFLLSETPAITTSSHVPRPSKVRKMFAMRACRSSIMIGKTLSHRQMEGVVERMGTIDKPWNCPHGRPTMRHLASLENLEATLWHEGEGLRDEQDTDRSAGMRSTAKAFRQYLL